MLFTLKNAKALFY